MKQSLKFILLALGFAALLGIAVFAYNNLSEGYVPKGESSSETSAQGEGSAPENEKEPLPAPDFTVLDIEGEEVSLSDFAGKPVVINFWATWCGYCKAEFPNFQNAYEEYGDDVVFMMVNVTDGMRETVEKASEFIAENEYTFPVYFDTELAAARTYGATSLPATLFVDAEGNVSAGYLGMLSEEKLTNNIKLILSAEK